MCLNPAALLILHRSLVPQGVDRVSSKHHMTPWSFWLQIWLRCYQPRLSLWLGATVTGWNPTVWLFFQKLKKRNYCLDKFVNTPWWAQESCEHEQSSCNRDPWHPQDRASLRKSGLQKRAWKKKKRGCTKPPKHGINNAAISFSREILLTIWQKNVAVVEERKMQGWPWWFYWQRNLMRRRC